MWRQYIFSLGLHFVKSISEPIFPVLSSLDSKTWRTNRSSQIPTCYGKSDSSFFITVASYDLTYHENPCLVT